MHRAPWWQVWGCVGLLSVVLWGETGCIAVLSDQVRQQADQTLTFDTDAPQALEHLLEVVRAIEEES